MPKKILWLSQHQPIPRQVLAIQKHFGADVRIRQDVNPFANARDVARKFREGGYDELVFIGPLSVLDALCQMGLNPWKAEVQEVPRRLAEWVIHGQGYKFSSFRKVARVIIEYVSGEEFGND